MAAGYSSPNIDGLLDESYDSLEERHKSPLGYPPHPTKEARNRATNQPSSQPTHPSTKEARDSKLPRTVFKNTCAQHNATFTVIPPATETKADQSRPNQPTTTKHSVRRRYVRGVPVLQSVLVTSRSTSNEAPSTIPVAVRLHDLLFQAVPSYCNTIYPKLL